MESFVRRTRLGKVVIIRLVESMTFIMLIACLAYLISLWQVMNPFGSLMHILSIQSEHHGYSIERIADAPRVHIAQLSSQQQYAAIHLPPSV